MSTEQEQLQGGPNEHQLQHAGGEHGDFPGSLESIISHEQALALQHIHAFHQSMPLITPPNFPRPTVKRRKPVKWESWEEKNLIEGVRRFGRGNWAQIRAAFEFNQCRTNVDLHDKWRVLTGERKRNRQAQRLASPQSPVNPPAITAAENPNEVEQTDSTPQNGAGSSNGSNSNNQKVQLIPVAGTNGLYTLSSFLPPGFNPASLMEGNGTQFPDFLQQMQQSELMGQHGHIGAQDGVLAADEVNHHAEEEAVVAAASNDDMDNMDESLKRTKKDDDEIAQELLKLSKAEGDDESSSDDHSKKGVKRSRKHKK